MRNKFGAQVVTEERAAFVREEAKRIAKKFQSAWWDQAMPASALQSAAASCKHVTVEQINELPAASAAAPPSSVSPCIPKSSSIPKSLSSAAAAKEKSNTRLSSTTPAQKQNQDPHSVGSSSSGREEQEVGQNGGKKRKIAQQRRREEGQREGGAGEIRGGGGGGGKKAARRRYLRVRGCHLVSKPPPPTRHADEGCAAPDICDAAADVCHAAASFGAVFAVRFFHLGAVCPGPHALVTSASQITGRVEEEGWITVERSSGKIGKVQELWDFARVVREEALELNPGLVISPEFKTPLSVQATLCPVHVTFEALRVRRTPSAVQSMRESNTTTRTIFSKLTLERNAQVLGRADARRNPSARAQKQAGNDGGAPISRPRQPIVEREWTKEVAR
eukprot:1216286-Rhodomonas_salina.1